MLSVASLAPFARNALRMNALPPSPAAARPIDPLFWCSLFLGGGLIFCVDRADDDRLAALAAGLALAGCLWVCLRGLRLDPLSPAMVYLYVFALFHLGLALPWALDLSAGPTPQWMQHHRLAPALTLVVAALVSFQLGATLAAGRGSPTATAAPNSTRPGGYYNNVLYHCGVVLAAAGVGMFAWGVRSLGVDRFLDASHFEMYTLTAWYDPRFFTTSMRVVPMGIYLAAAAAPARRVRLILAFAGLWCALIFVLGFRGYALVPAVALLALLRKRGIVFSKLTYAAGLAAILIAIPVTRLMRENPLGERWKLESWSEVTPFEAVQEMGVSIRPLVHTLEYMNNEPYRWGSTYWRALTGVLPNLSSRWREASYVPIERLPPDHWVTKQAEPHVYRQHGGLGFSAVAEPYMNFGPLGVAAYFFALAFGLVRADRADASRPTRLALGAMVLGPLLWTTRNDFNAFFRPALWGVGAVLAARLLADSLARTGAGNRLNGRARNVAPLRIAGRLDSTL